MQNEFSGLIPDRNRVTIHWSDRNEEAHWLPEVWVRFRSGVGICETALMTGRLVGKLLSAIPNGACEVVSLKAPPGKALPSVGIAIRSRTRSEPITAEVVRSELGKLIGVGD